ncbi:MAG: hypothetical protein AAGE76_01245 [Pseudomonadota bacterium]
MKRFLFSLMIATPAIATAETVLLDIGALPTRPVYDVAELTPLALTADGAPAMLLLSLDAGDVVPPHATESGLRMLTVLSGEMSWGDGDEVNEGAERTYGPGSILAVRAGDMHWVAARRGPVQIQLVLLDDETPVPGIQEQLQ